MPAFLARTQQCAIQAQLELATVDEPRQGIVGGLERQLGYKMAKYVMRIELVEDLAGIGAGKGGYWEDQGYEWYGGI